ncbi:MAG: acyltransferase [Gammaproteobacteria bacterium]|nr:acyltransferase [Gammaproteobacteria bacterium]MDH3411291.1 acyltransferase [Gammaproteobacteria bacterium]
MKTGQSGRFEEIDVLRGLAAMCVVLSHYSTHGVKFFREAPFGLDLDTIYGFYAVQLFFIISGFVISLTLEKSNSWRDFAFSRLSRLYPAYWAAVTLMVVVEFLVFGKALWISGYLTNLTMLQEFIGFTNLDNVFWSLTVELAFYAIMGILFATGLWPRIEVVAAIWLALACLWSLVDQHLGIGLPAFLPRFLILRHVPFFVAGIMFYRVTVKGLTPQRLALILAALAATGWIDAVPGTNAAALGWIDALRRVGVAVILFAIFSLAVTDKLRFAVSPVTLWLGRISYPLYLSHRNLGFSTMFRLHELGVPVWFVFTVTLVGALVLATALAYLVERPAMRALRQWYRMRTAVVGP